MINHTVLAGRLCADPILRTSPMGHSVCNFTVACDREGRKRRSAEIVAERVHFGDSKPKDQTKSAQTYSSGAAQGQSHAGLQSPSRELPF